MVQFYLAIFFKNLIPNPEGPKISYKTIIDFVRKHSSRQSPSDRFLSKISITDGFENTQRLNIISRAIIVYPQLVLLWKENGYDSICHDFNDAVLLGNFRRYIESGSEEIVPKSQDLINMGFELTKSTMAEIIYFFDNRLTDVGGLIIKSFQEIR